MQTQPTQQIQPTQQFQQMYPAQAPQYYAQPIPRQQFADSDAKLHISDLHESITEEVLWSQFKRFGTVSGVRIFRDKEKKSRKYAKISFSTVEAAKFAQKEMNLSLLIKNMNIPGQKIIKVTKDLNKEQLEELKKNNIFFSGIPKNISDDKEIYNWFTQFGEIHSLHITKSSKKRAEEGEFNAGFGFVLFQDKKSNEDLLAKKEEEYRAGVTVTFQSYQSRGQRETRSATPNNVYINEFTDVIFPENYDEESQKATTSAQLEKLKGELEKALASYGTITSTFLQVDKKTRKPFAFVCFEDAKNAEKLYIEVKQEDSAFRKAISNSLVYVNYKENKNQSTVIPDGQFLFVKNLKSYNNEEEKAAIVEQCKRVFGKFGKIRRFELKKGEKPAGAKKELADACFAQLLYSSQEEGYQCIMGYLHDNDVKELFLNNNAHGSITILLPMSERKRMISSQFKHQKNQQTAQQQQIMIQQQQALQQQYPQGRSQGFQQFNNRRPQANFQQNNQNYNHGQNRGRQGGVGFNNNNNQNPGRGGQYNNQKQQQPRPFQGNQPQQEQAQTQQAEANKTPAQAPMDTTLNLESLKANLTTFTNLESSKQSQILGNLIFPKVKAIVQSANKPENLAPKITGMLIDFQVFDVADILDILESEEELKERVNEAIELIQQQQ